jgi:hypothetical protein
MLPIASGSWPSVHHGVFRGAAQGTLGTDWPGELGKAGALLRERGGAGRGGVGRGGAGHTCSGPHSWTSRPWIMTCG